jgi:hypothetical protein
MADTGFSFKRELARKGAIVEGKGTRGLLDIPPSEILRKVEPVIEEAKQRPLRMLGQYLLLGQAPLDLNSLVTAPASGSQSAPATPPASAQSALTTAEPSGGVYTETEYSLFMDFLKALGGRLALLKAGGKPTVDALVKVLELHLAVKQKNPELPLFNSECEVLKRSINDLWRDVKAAFDLPGSMKVQAGTELSDALKAVKGDPAKTYATLIRLQKDVDDVTQRCLDVKSKAY